MYNGEFGCSACLHPGKRLSNGARVYLPNKYPMRTHDKVIEGGKKASTTGKAVNGVKGVSPYHHPSILCTQFQLNICIQFWRVSQGCCFHSKNHGKAFHLGRKVSDIDAVLIKQRPPHEVSHCPRSITSHMHWKASELRNWLLFYSLPFLHGFLPLYLHHYALLVCAMHILLQEKIALSQIDAAELMLNEFYLMMPELYGESSCTSNVHSLSHLAMYVRQLGPLWSYSAFCTESKNGQLKHLYHGRGNIVDQLIFNTDIELTLQLLHKLLKQHENETTLQYLDRNCHHLHLRTQMMCVGEHAYFIGPGSSSGTNEERKLINCGNGNIMKFSTFLKDGMIYCSAMKSAKGKRNSSICTYSTDNATLEFGCIQFFVLSSTPPKAVLKPFAFHSNSWYKDAGPCCRDNLQLYKETDLLTKANLILKVRDCVASPLVCISLDQIVSKAVLVKGHVNELYVIRQPNKFDHN